ncbi:MAG: TetR/AcrR family transcriptional regulator [Saprospiraceae bacterium]|nr:TetR/AcrR family transcriptional regulator [Saprospiraceae bacterium]
MERKITREKFIETALELFHGKGFKATTMRDIARALDIEAATLYNYIRSKQQLLDDLVFEIAHQFHDGLSDIYDSSYTPVEKLKAIVNLNVRLTAAHPYQVALLVSEWKHLKEDRQREFLENRSSYEQMVRSTIQHGMEQQELRPMQLEIATYSFLSSIRWLFSWYIEQDENINPIELEKQIADFILKGMQNFD